MKAPGKTGAFYLNSFCSSITRPGNNTEFNCSVFVLFGVVDMHHLLKNTNLHFEL